MTVEESISFLTGFLFSLVWGFLITIYYKLRERMARLEAWVEYRKPTKHPKGAKPEVTPKEV